MTTDTRDLGELARAVAALLNGEHFTVETPEAGERHYVRLVAPDGRAFSLNNSWSGRGKLHVSGCYPKDGDKYMGPREWGAIGYNEQAPSINVSAEREPGPIARDISRRFLPEYTRVYQACEAKRAEHVAYLATVNNAAAQLEALIPGSEVREHDGQGAVYFHTSEHGYGELMPYSDTVNMDLRSLPLALALKVAAVLGARD
jgi:hypothetical protein